MDICDTDITSRLINSYIVRLERFKKIPVTGLVARRISLSCGDFIRASNCEGLEKRVIRVGVLSV